MNKICKPSHKMIQLFYLSKKNKIFYCQKVKTINGKLKYHIHLLFVRQHRKMISDLIYYSLKTSRMYQLVE